MKNLKLERPLAVFDLETTGTRPEHDRIVEICVLLVRPDGSEEVLTRRVNPGVPIPAGASAVHGILDEDVAGEPLFRELAPQLLEMLKGADLAGFNVIGFDLPLLEAEFKRIDLPFSREGHRLVDAQRIYHQRERRTLSAAVKFYTGKELVGAHGAEADVRATLDVLDSQVAHYDDLPADVDGLALACVPENWVDDQGKIRWVDGEATFEIGKHRGVALRQVVKEDPSYLRWMADKSDFPADTRRVVAAALAGRLPEPPGQAAKKAEPRTEPTDESRTVRPMEPGETPKLF